MKGKRGITAQTIITIFLAIAGFVIILGALFFGGVFELSQQNQGLCELEILSRATSPEEAKGIVPLDDCITSKICFTDKPGERCENQFAGEEKVKVVVLKGSDEEKAKKISEETTLAFYKGYLLTRKGRLDLFGKWAKARNLEVEDVNCIIPYRLAIDSSVEDKIIEEVNIHEYMEDNEVPGGGLTYLQAITDKGVTSYPNIDGETFKKINKKIEEASEKTEKALGSEIGRLDENGREVAVVFSQVKTTDALTSWKALGEEGAIVLVGGAFATSPLKVARTLLLTTKGIVGVAVGVGAGAAYTGVNAYRSGTFAAGYCGEFVTNIEVEEGEDNKKLRSGCSLNNLVPYTFKNVDAICDNIEGGA